MSKRKATTKKGKTVYTVVKPELKGVDTDIVATAIVDTTSTNEDIRILNLIQQGTGSFNRVGRRVSLKSVRIWGDVIFSTEAITTTGNINMYPMRMILVWDKQPAGIVPPFNQMFGSTEQDGTVVSDVWDMINYPFMDRYQILRDLKIQPAEVRPPELGATGSFNTLFSRVHFDEYVDLQGRRSTYNGTANPLTVANLETGALYLIYRQPLQDSQFEWSVSGFSKARVRYTDA